MAEGPSKNLKVVFEDQKKLVAYIPGEDFFKKCRERFGIEKTVDIILTDENGFEVDEETLENLTATTVLTIKQKSRIIKEKTDSKEEKTLEELLTNIDFGRAETHVKENPNKNEKADLKEVKTSEDITNVDFGTAERHVTVNTKTEENADSKREKTLEDKTNIDSGRAESHVLKVNPNKKEKEEKTLEDKTNIDSGRTESHVLKVNPNKKEKSLKMAEGPSKNLKVVFEDQKKLVAYIPGGDFFKKCRERFGIEKTVDIILTDENGFEVDEETLENLTATTVLTIKQMSRIIKEKADLKEVKTSEDITNVDFGTAERHVTVNTKTEENADSKGEKTLEDKTNIDSGRAESHVLKVNPNKKEKEENTLEDKTNIDSGRTESHVLKVNPNKKEPEEQKDEDDITSIDLGSVGNPGQTVILKNEGSKTKQSRVDVNADIDFGSDEVTVPMLNFKSDDDVKNFVERYEDFNIDDLFGDIFNAWQHEQIKLAITGISGKGKSTLINALLGVPETDGKAAETGETETTQKPTEYRHPVFKNILLWDLPGCGTKTYPQETYLDDVSYQEYDFFLVVSADRFLVAECDIVKQLKKCEKRVYFVRTKVDNDMSSIRRKKGEKMKDDFEFSELKKNVKTEILRNIQDTYSHSDILLFLVSGIYPQLYDFPDLQNKLVEDAAIQKRLSIVFGLTAFSNKFLQMKERAINARMELIAIYSMIEGESHKELKFPCTLQIIQNELDFYRRQFALNKESLETLASTVRITVSDVLKTVTIRSSTVTLDEELKSTLAQYYMQPNDDFRKSFAAKYKEQHTWLKSIIESIRKYLRKNRESPGLDLSVMNDETAISAIVSTLHFYSDVMFLDAQKVMTFIVEKAQGIDK